MDREKTIDMGKQESPKDRGKENITKIRELLAEKGLSAEDVDSVIGLVNTEISETLADAVNPELMFNDIEANADTEWRPIGELARVRLLGGTEPEFAHEIKRRFPGLEIRIDGDGPTSQSIKVRKINQ